MIKIKGKKAVFTGKDAKILKSLAKKLGLSQQNCFTGMLWEYIMTKAREGLFLNEKMDK